MEMGKKCSWCFAVLVSSLGFIFFVSCFELFPFLLIISVLILPTIFLLNNTQKNLGFNQKPAGNLLFAQQNLLGEEDQALETTQKSDEKGKNCGYQVELLDATSESDESNLVPSENIELNFSSGDNADEKVEIFYCSSVSVSDDDDDDDDDEESLIEIKLPSSEEEPKPKLQENFADSILGQQAGVGEMMIAEMNEMSEEENLIEIDISMGSIKCPRFEIEA